ncbi:MAG: DUF1360 domain-containing protein [Planctomycetaceae bacterium]|jgi:hypothetical protein|nr:DUF1360 domain-containing protein [Planctomycetaceae bacterium]
MFILSEFILFCFAVTGMTLILVQGSIFESFRAKLARSVESIERNREENDLPHRFSIVGFLHKMLQCLQCAGFWCGIFCGFFLLASDMLILGYTSQVFASALELNNWSILIRNCLTLFRWIMILFCCGVAGSFLAPLGDLLLQWIFVSKELIAKQLHAESHQTNEQNNDDINENL